MKITILTLFPAYFISPFEQSILKRALEQKLAEIEIVDIRDFSQDKHRKTDDRPFGGGPGMVMMVEPIDLALQGVKKRSQGSKRKVVLTSAKGKLYNQQKALEYVGLDELVIICGHYEGVDERVAEHLVDEEIRIGDYVLTGGEPAAAVIVDSVVRLLPGVLGNEESAWDESHAIPGQLGYPQYTRPQNYRGWEVPEVLMTGDHGKIKEWREKQKQ